jgi:hypothetical protein
MIALLLLVAAAPLQTVSFPAQDGGTVVADLYGAGRKGLILAH